MALDAQDKTDIAEMIAASLKANKPEGLTAEQVGKVVADQLGNLKLDEKITAAVDAAKPKKGPTDDKKEDTAAAEYKARMEALEAKQLSAEEREKSAVAREREERLRGELGRALEANGIPRERHEQAIAYLRTKKSAHSGKSVFDFDDNGAPIFRKAGKGYDDSLSVADGIKGWSATDEAKLYRPPAERRGAGGSSGRSGGSSSGGKNETSLNTILGQLDLTK